MFCMDRSCIVQLNRLVEINEAFGNLLGNRSKQSSMFHIMVLLEYLGSYANEASLQKIGQMMSITKVT